VSAWFIYFLTRRALEANAATPRSHTALALSAALTATLAPDLAARRHDRRRRDARRGARAGRPLWSVPRADAICAPSSGSAP
jgi:hypothetical protein